MEENNTNDVLVPTQVPVWQAQEFLTRLEQRETYDGADAVEMSLHLVNCIQQFNICFNRNAENAEQARRSEAEVQRVSKMYQDKCVALDEALQKIEDIHGLIKKCVEENDLDVDSSFVQEMISDHGLRLGKGMDVRIKLTGYMLVTLSDVPYDWEINDVEDALANGAILSFDPQLPNWIGDNDEVEVDLYDSDVEIEEIEEM